jgi:GNAT superfamily N-acetyltransferase
VAGWVWGCRQSHVCGYSQVRLYEIGVAEPARRRGIGRALLTAFREHAIREGHRRMWLFTDEDNQLRRRYMKPPAGSLRPTMMLATGGNWTAPRPSSVPGSWSAGRSPTR